MRDVLVLVWRKTTKRPPSTVREVFGPRIDNALRAVLVEGPPVRVLLDQARGTLLLALGRKAHGVYEPTAIGAVGRERLRHATVGVVTVPLADKAAAPLGVVRSGAA